MLIRYVDGLCGLTTKASRQPGLIGPEALCFEDWLTSHIQRRALDKHYWWEDGWQAGITGCCDVLLSAFQEAIPATSLIVSARIVVVKSVFSDLDVLLLPSFWR